MRKIELSVNSIIVISAVLVVLAGFCAAGIARTEIPLKCHVCDPDTCKTFNKKAEPKECTVNDLDPENIGPSKLNDLSYITFKPIDMKVPEFLCQKLEAYDLRGIYIVRKCQLKLPGNESCANFYRNLNADPERSYINASCHLCDREGCNSGDFVYIWMPLLLSSIIVCLLMK